ncbi:MAG: hypothetical protein OJF55_000508 [Rhodanobacteraceae bacterium]|jgi:hypothetical protein|nr:MAG: hypothetical protein OJF55_000508 [Rhodanobacteraceae bacterium]
MLRFRGIRRGQASSAVAIFATSVRSCDNVAIIGAAIATGTTPRTL